MCLRIRDVWGGGGGGGLGRGGGRIHACVRLEVCARV